MLDGLEGFSWPAVTWAKPVKLDGTDFDFVLFLIQCLKERYALKVTMNVYHDHVIICIPKLFHT